MSDDVGQAKGASITVHVAPNAKFSCWFFSGTPVGKDVPADAHVEEDVYAAQSLDVQWEEHWQKGLGSFVTEAIAQGGLGLYVTAPSNRPEILDWENEGLRRRCEDVLHGLLIQGVPEFERAMSLVGANVRGTIEIRTYASGREVEPTYETEPFVPDLASIRRAIRFAERLRMMQDARGAEWGRLLHSVRFLRNGNRVTNAHGERFHQFVRVIDGLTKTRQGRGARDFAHRAQTFALPSEETRQVLLEMYEVRGKIEHVNPMLDVIQLHPPFSENAVVRKEAQIAKANRMMRQVDALARFSVTTILDSNVLFETFRTEDGIDSFWSSLRDDERAKRFGHRLDVRTIH